MWTISTIFSVRVGTIGYLSVIFEINIHSDLLNVWQQVILAKWTEYSHTYSSIAHIHTFMILAKKGTCYHFSPYWNNLNHWTLKMAPKIIALNIQRILKNKRFDTIYDLISKNSYDWVGFICIKAGKLSAEQCTILTFPSVSNFKSFSRSLEQFFLTVGQNNFGNKIPFHIHFHVILRPLFMCLHTKYANVTRKNISSFHP